MNRRELIRGGLLGATALSVPPELWRALGRVADDRPYLATAQLAANWLARTAHRSGAEAWWHADPDHPGDVSHDLYNGTTGVLPFWVELHAATGDARAGEMVRASANHLLKALDSADKTDAGLYTGLAGIGWALGLAYGTTNDTAHRDGALRALDLVEAGATLNGDGRIPSARWADSTDIVSGWAGTGLYLLWANRTFGRDSTMLLARGAAIALMQEALPGASDDQRRWKVNKTIAREYPNFSHGTAGVSFFLAQLNLATKGTAYLDMAIAGANYLQAIDTETAHDGRMVHHSMPGNEQLFYMSWCHGPSGTARLFHTLAECTEQLRYRRYADQLATATREMKVPERSPGFWNNISRCCGNCGVTEYYVARYRTMRDRKALTYAQAVARDAIARGTRDGDGMKWVQAENRVSPDAVVAQTGLMQGAAGVGLSMLQLDGAMRGRRRAVVLPDDPFGT